MGNAKLIVVIASEESKEACKACIDSVHAFRRDCDIFCDDNNSISRELEPIIEIKHYDDLFPLLLEKCCEDNVSIFIATADSNIKTARRLTSMKCAKVIEL